MTDIVWVILVLAWPIGAWVVATFSTGEGNPYP